MRGASEVDVLVLPDDVHRELVRRAERAGKSLLTGDACIADGAGIRGAVRVVVGGG